MASGLRSLKPVWHSPRDFVGRLKAAAAPVIPKFTSVRQTLSALRLGVGVIGINGFEGTGHPRDDHVPGLVLIPVAVQVLHVPVAASGGIATGVGMPAGLAPGSEAVDMGARFFAAVEAPIHEDIKQALFAPLGNDTHPVLRMLRNCGRAMNSRVSDDLIAIERRPGGCTFFDLQPPVMRQRGRAALARGDFHAGLVWTEQPVGLLDDILSRCQRLSDLVTQCRDRIAKASAMVAIT